MYHVIYIYTNTNTYNKQFFILTLFLLLLDHTLHCKFEPPLSSPLPPTTKIHLITSITQFSISSLIFESGMSMIMADEPMVHARPHLIWYSYRLSLLN